MKKTSTDSTNPSAPACWQRESTTACLRIELDNGELHILPYSHLISARFAKAADGTETLQIKFSSHEVQIEGQALRDLVLGIQDFAIKWLRAMPEKYVAVMAVREGVITRIRVVSVEE